MQKRIVNEEQNARQRQWALDWYYANKDYVLKRMKAKRLAQRPEYLKRKIAELKKELEQYG